MSARVALAEAFAVMLRAVAEMDKKDKDIPLSLGGATALGEGDVAAKGVEQVKEGVR